MHSGERSRGSEAQSTVSKRTFLTAVGSGAAASLAGCLGSVRQGTDTVRVGAVYPLSGAVAETGQNIQKFINSAVEDVINAEASGLEGLSLAGEAGLPNLDGATVEVTFADHRGDPGQGRAEAERLIQEQDVDVLVGGYHSSVTKTMSATAERAGVPHVNFESSSPELTERGLNWFWRTGPHDGTYTQNMFTFFDGMNEQQDAGIESVAIIHEDTEFGTISAETQQRLAEENGYEVAAGPIAYTAESVTSLESEVQRIQQADPDVLLPSSYIRDAQILMNDMQTLGYFPPMVMGQDAGFNQPSFVEQTEISDYVCTRSTYADDLPETVPEIGAYAEFVQENVGMGFNGVYIRSWGGFITAMHAVNEAGSTDPAAIQEALNNLSVERFETGLPYGVEFADSGQNDLATGVLIQYEGGSGNTIWPFDLSQTDPVYPAPGWDER
jgi:branched-chain amino acid transport system substrate-binding protein